MSATSAPLDDDRVRDGLARLDGWERDGDTIRNRWSFGSFRAAIDFVVRVADLAEEADHHPELTNVYDRVTIALTSHDVGGITERDLALAARIDGVVTA